MYVPNSEWPRILNMSLVVNVPEFWIYRVLNMPLVLNIPEFWICQTGLYKSNSEWCMFTYSHFYIICLLTYFHMKIFVRLQQKIFHLHFTWKNTLPLMQLQTFLFMKDWKSQAYSEPSGTSKMELFVKIVNS